MQCLFFHQIASNGSRLPSKIKVSAYTLARDRLTAAKSVIVEGVSGFVKLLSQPVVSLVEIERAAVIVAG